MEITTKENQKVRPSSASRGALNSGKTLNGHVEFAQRKRENWDSYKTTMQSYLNWFLFYHFDFLFVNIN